MAAQHKFENLISISTGISLPDDSFFGDDWIYGEKYSYGLIGKFNYTIKYQYVSLGVDVAFSEGYIKDTEHINHHGNPTGFSIVFPLSLYLKENDLFAWSVYGAFGRMTFTQYGHTRIKMRGDEIIYTSFPGIQSKILSLDMGTRFRYHLGKGIFSIASMSYHFNSGFFGADFNLPNLSVGLGYNFSYLY